MAIQLIKKCPGCGHDDLHRIERKWYMRLIPFSKRYHCKECRSNFVVNLWVAIVLIPIIFSLKMFSIILLRLPGFSHLWQKIHTPESSSEEESWRVLNQFQC